MEYVLNTLSGVTHIYRVISNGIIYRRLHDQVSYSFRVLESPVTRGLHLTLTDAAFPVLPEGGAMSRLRLKALRLTSYSFSNLRLPFGVAFLFSD